MCQSEGTHQIVMSFSPPIISCLLKKSSQKGGHGHPRTSPPPLGDINFNEEEIFSTLLEVREEVLMTMKRSISFTEQATLIDTNQARSKI